MLYDTRNPHGGDVYAEPIRLDFSANTNPYGTPQGVLDAVQDSLSRLHQYPDPYCRELIHAIARHENVPPEYLLCGNGAAELIYSYCEAVQVRRAVEFAPTFSEYSAALLRTGGQMLRYILKSENSFAPDGEFLSFLRQTDPEAVFLCSPNNPTGQLIPEPLLSEILDFCRERGVRLFLDECFLDLSEGGNSMKNKLAETPQLCILKAFTKSYGMAGVRLGYCMTSDAALLRRMSQTVQPWNVSLPAQAAGIAALREQDFLHRTRETIFIEKRYLRKSLQALGLEVYSSAANYLLFHGPAALHSRLKSHGIAIRSCDNYHGLGPGWYRIAVRLHPQNEQLIEAMRQVLNETNPWRES